MIKSYNELIREISNTKFYRGLLAFGMFTDKLPPIFTAVDFYSYCDENKPNFAKKPKHLIQFESMRNTNVPISCAKSFCVSTAVLMLG